jgi:drug/metabolite transporter (DMT)-like permease
MDGYRDRDGADATVKTGIALKISSALIAPGNDTLAKALSQFLSPLQIGFWRFFLQALLIGIAGLVMRRGLRPGVPAWMVIMAGLFIAATGLAMMAAVAVMPVATVIAIFFVQPLVLTLFSVVFLGEHAGWRRIGAVAAGFAGALIVIRPGLDQFGWPVLLPLAAAVSIASYMTLIRQIGARMNPYGLQFWANLVAAGAAGLVLTVTGLEFWTPEAAAASGAIWLMALLALTSTATFLLMTQAFRMAPAGVLAPFQYFEIVAATTLGYVVFGDFPDAQTWLGTAIILASGLYVYHRERQTRPGAKP